VYPEQFVLSCPEQFLVWKRKAVIFIKNGNVSWEKEVNEDV